MYMNDKKEKKDHFSMKIEKIDSAKHDIKQRALMKAGVIPHHPSITIFSGSAGSGKTNLVNNMLTKSCMYGKSMEDTANDDDKHMYKKKTPKQYFDIIYLLIGSDDDMYDNLIEKEVIDKDNVVHMPKISDVQKIIDSQKSILKKEDGDITKIPKILVIFDDVVNDSKLMNSNSFKELFVKGRHINSSTWLLTQYLNMVNKGCRMQANYLACFKMNRAELNILYDQYCPPEYNKTEFFNMCVESTRPTEDNPNPFLFISKKAPIEQRFRSGLDHFILLDKYEKPELDTKDILKELRQTKRKKKKDVDTSDEEKNTKEHPVKSNNIKERTNVLPMETPKLVLDRSTLMRVSRRNVT